MQCAGKFPSFNMNYITAKGYWGSDAKYISVPGSGVMSAVVVSVGPGRFGKSLLFTERRRSRPAARDPNLSMIAGQFDLLVTAIRP